MDLAGPVLVLGGPARGALGGCELGLSGGQALARDALVVQGGGQGGGDVVDAPEPQADEQGEQAGQDAVGGSTDPVVVRPRQHHRADPDGEDDGRHHTGATGSVDGP